MSDSKYDPNYQGSNTDPAPSCDGPIGRETAADLEKARKACELHRAVNKLADRGRK